MFGLAAMLVGVAGYIAGYALWDALAGASWIGVAMIGCLVVIPIGALLFAVGGVGWLLSAYRR